MSLARVMLATVKATVASVVVLKTAEATKNVIEAGIRRVKEAKRAR